MKRITFTEQEACHILEMHLALLQGFPDEKECSVGEHIRERLEKFIGEKETKRIKRAVNKNPYFR